MPSFTNSYTEPGTYVAINDDVLTQTNTGLLSVCIIGTGKKTKSINNLELELIPPTNSFNFAEILTPTNFDALEVSGWTANTSYVKDDYVTYEGKLYQCINPEGSTSETFVVSDWAEIQVTDVEYDDHIDRTINVGDYIYYINTKEEDSLANKYYKCKVQTSIVYTYPEWEKNKYYASNDLVFFDDLYFNCIESHTSVDTDSPDGTYWKKYWKEVEPEYNNYSAVIPNSDTYPVLSIYEPTKVIGAITTKVYDNYIKEDGTSSDEKIYFTITNINEPNNKLIWINSTLPSTDKNAQGRYVLTLSYTAEKVTSDGNIKSYTRLSSIFSAYGAPSAENTISTAAQIAYDNGATVFYCVQPLNDGDIDDNNNLTRSGLQEGLRQAQNVDTYCILPMMESTSETNIATICKSHVEKMSSTLERKERICILSDAAKYASSSEAIEQLVEDYKSAASAINSSRILYITPSAVNVNIENDVIPGSGMYAAAALAGIICNNNYTCGEPITGKTLADVSINDIFTREEKNQLASYGCLVLEGAEGTTIPKIRHALSTATGDYVKSEIKITKIKDVISSTLRLALDRAYINTRFLGASTISEMTTTVNTILSSFLANNDIYSYNNLVIAQDQNYPNQVNVSFRIAPAVDLNYILITFGVTFQE